MNQERRGFGAIDGASLVVASVVGAGIFTVPAYVAKSAGSPAVVLALWVAGGLLALAGALCYAELATRSQRGGAEYVYLREAFGETAGFLSGWTSFIAGFSGAIAAAAVAFAAHAIGVIPGLAGIAAWTGSAGPVTFTISPTTIVAIATIVVFTIVSVAGIGASRLATNGLALLIVAGLAILALGGSFTGATSRVDSAESSGGMSALSALVPIFFTYSGWNAAAYVAGEFRNPRRDIPRALVGGTLAVTLLYVGVNAAMLSTLSLRGLAASSTPVASAAGIVFGVAGGTLTTALVLAALASSVCALVITGPRIYREMARDGALPSVFGKSSRQGAPIMASIAQSAWSILLVLTGTFGEIVTYTGFAILIFSGAAVGAVIVLRKKYGAPETFAVPGYPIVPVAFIFTVLLVSIASFRFAPGPSIAGVLLILAGLPVRLLSRQVVVTA